VILTTHYMDEADALADRVGVLVDGRLVAQGTPASLANRDRAEVRIRFRLPPGTDTADIPLIGSPGTTLGPEGEVEIRTAEDVVVLAELTRWSLSEQIPLSGLTVERATLEDTYLRLTGYRQAAAIAPVPATRNPS
jgi:ABC-2 type transport system ATP-binding protein